MRTMHRVALLVCLIYAVGCGPVAYVHQVTFNADSAIEEARKVQADKFSPYWWTRAITYIHMAREVAGHADFQGANRFGRLAEEAAIEAKKEGEQGQTDPSKLPYIKLDTNKLAPAKEKTDVAPAKDEP